MSEPTERSRALCNTERDASLIEPPLSKTAPQAKYFKWVQCLHFPGPPQEQGPPYRDTSLIRNTPLPGPYRRTDLRVLWWS